MSSWGLHRLRPQQKNAITLDANKLTLNELGIRPRSWDPIELIKHTKQIYKCCAIVCTHQFEMGDSISRSIRHDLQDTYLTGRQQLAESISFYISHGLLWTTLKIAIAGLAYAEIWFGNKAEALVHATAYRQVLAETKQWEDYTALEKSVWMNKCKQVCSVADPTSGLQLSICPIEQELLPAQYEGFFVHEIMLDRIYQQAGHRSSTREVEQWFSAAARLKTVISTRAQGPAD